MAVNTATQPIVIPPSTVEEEGTVRQLRSRYICVFTRTLYQTKLSSLE